MFVAKYLSQLGRVICLPLRRYALHHSYFQNSIKNEVQCHAAAFANVMHHGDRNGSKAWGANAGTFIKYSKLKIMAQANSPSYFKSFPKSNYDI